MSGDADESMVASMEQGYRLASQLVARATTRSARAISAQIGASTPAHGVDVVRDVGTRIGQRTNHLIRELRKQTKEEIELGVEQRAPRIVTAFEQGFVRAALYLAPRDSLAPHMTLEVEQKIRARIRVQTRRHEEKMLRTAMPGEPTCCNGQRCQGLRIRCQGGGAVLMAFWPESIWSKYENPANNFKLPPRRSQICLLCMRFAVFTRIAELRATNYAFRNQNFQCTNFVNLVDVANEYRAEDCIGISPHVFEGVLGNVVMPSVNCFRRVDDTVAGCVRFAQELPFPHANAQSHQSFS